MSTKIAILMVLLCFAILGGVPAAHADYYKYTDRGGAVNLTNKLAAVPAKYRSTMKVIKEDTPAKKAPAAQPESAGEESVTPVGAAVAAPAPVPQGRFAKLSARFVWFKPLLYLGLILAIFVAVTKLTAWLPSPLLSKVIYLAFFLGVFVILYKAYVEYTVESALAVKEKAVTMFKKSMVREALPDGETLPAQSTEQSGPASVR